MTDTPAPAPALTDEQIDERAEYVRRAYIYTNASKAVYSRSADEDRVVVGNLFDTWYAAVITRAKRETAEYIAQTLAADALAADTAGQSEDYIAGVTHGQMIALRVARENGANHV